MRLAMSALHPAAGQKDRSLTVAALLNLSCYNTDMVQLFFMIAIKNKKWTDSSMEFSAAEDTAKNQNDHPPAL